MLVSTAGYSLMNAMVKELSHLPVFEVVFFRSFITVFLCVSILKMQKVPLIGNNQKLLIISALGGVGSMLLFFYTVQNIPFGSAVVLKYLSPIFAAIMAVFFLKEQVRPIQWGFFFISFVGLILMKGFDLRIDNFNLLLGLAGALVTGMTWIVIKKISTSEHPLTVVNYMMVCGTIVAGIYCLFNWQTPSNSDLLLLSIAGVAGFIGQWFITKAFQIELASNVAPLKYMEIFFALIVGWIWFGETYSLLSFVGIGLILTGMLLNVFFARGGQHLKGASHLNDSKKR